jgi:hypothetical protein
MGQKAKWVLPTVVNPGVQRCYQVKVPDDPQHIAAFFGAMYALTKPYNWEDDSAHTAIDVGAVWDDIYQQLAVIECGTAIFPIVCSEGFITQGTPWLSQNCIGYWLLGGWFNSSCELDGITYDGIYIYLDLPSGANFSYIEVYFDLTKGFGPRVSPEGIYVFNGGSLAVYNQLSDWHLLGDGLNQTLRLDVSTPIPATRIYVQLLNDEYNGSVVTAGNMRIFGATVGLTGVSACP